MTRVVTWIVVVVLALAVHSPRASAQGWAEDRGTLTLAANYAYQFSDGTFHSTSLLVTGTPADSQQFNLRAEYVPLDRLTFATSVNSAATRYTGPNTNPGDPTVIVAHGRNDFDHKFHYALTDLEVEARYALLNERFGLSPAIRVQVPMTDYEVRGYAAHGSGLKEAGAGVYFNMLRAPFDRSSFGASYLFTLVQKEDLGGAATEAYSMNRSDLGLSWGYAITDAVSASLVLNGRITHGGFNLSDIMSAPPDVVMWHDPILKKDFLSVSVVSTYAITESLTVALGAGFIPIGLNVSNAKTISLTFIWTRAP